MPFYLTPEQDDFNKIPELQICIAEALYDVDSIVADPGVYTREELASLLARPHVKSRQLASTNTFAFHVARALFE